MKLLLTSSGNTNISIEKALRQLLGKPFHASHLTFIPTAANVEEDTSGWLENDIQNFRKLGFSSLDVMDISRVGENTWQPSMEKADVLVFGGGNVRYLIEWVRKVGMDTILPKLLESKVYVGISAGSMITAKNIILSYSGILYYEDTGGFENIPGLGYVDFEIRPHLNSHFFPKVRLPVLEEIAEKGRGSFYAIDDNTAVVVSNERISVVSEGKWKKFN